MLLTLINTKNVKSQKYNGKSLIKWQIRNLKRIKRMDNNCHILDLVQAFS